MTDQSRSSSPDPWAQAGRIAEEWKQAGRGVDRRTQVARVQAARARRAAAVSEARIKASVDRAVREALASPEFAESLDQAAQAGSSVPVAPSVPGKPLHEMSAEEWREHTRETWASRTPYARRPMTIQDWVNGRYMEDGES